MKKSHSIQELGAAIIVIWKSTALRGWDSSKELSAVLITS
jgi:hypothetical protein